MIERLSVVIACLSTSSTELITDNSHKLPNYPATTHKELATCDSLIIILGVFMFSLCPRQQDPIYCVPAIRDVVVARADGTVGGKQIRKEEKIKWPQIILFEACVAVIRTPS